MSAFEVIMKLIELQCSWEIAEDVFIISTPEGKRFTHPLKKVKTFESEDFFAFFADAGRHIEAQ
jgi:hypothetical protein